MKTILAKSILTTRKKPEFWFDVKYNMNLYRGCVFGCLYCDSRSDCYHVENFDEIAAKSNGIELLEKELAGKRQTGVVGMGAMSDPYNPFEVDQKLTRQALELIEHYGFGLHLATKSHLILRDVDVIARIASQAPVSIGITITNQDDRVAALIEPGAPASSLRFEAVKGLSENGVFTGVLLMPVLPFINDTMENVMGIVNRSSQCGAGFIYPWMGMSLRAGQREYFYRGLEKNFPGQGLKERYIKTYGEQYECLSPNHQALMTAFKARCDELGLAYRMPDIIRGAEKHVVKKQLSLFDGL